MYEHMYVYTYIYYVWFFFYVCLTVFASVPPAFSKTLRAVFIIFDF